MLSETEFVEALRQHRHILHKVSGLYMDAKADREDLFQEIVLNAWKGVRHFRAESKFSTWLYRVALNTAITYFKKDLKKQTLEASMAFMAETDEAAVEKEEQVTAMNKAISHLSSIDKALVSLYLDDYSYAEIAEIMGITVNNIAVKMNRIKLKLKENSRKYL